MCSRRWKRNYAAVNCVAGRAQGPLAAAPNSLSLQRAYDLPGGTGRWEPRYSLGTFPLRFPQEEEPDSQVSVLPRRGRFGGWPTARMPGRGVQSGHGRDRPWAPW